MKAKAYQNMTLNLEPILVTVKNKFLIINNHSYVHIYVKETKNLILATGASPLTPPIPGFPHIRRGLPLEHVVIIVPFLW